MKSIYQFLRCGKWASCGYISMIFWEISFLSQQQNLFRQGYIYVRPTNLNFDKTLYFYLQ